MLYKVISSSGDASYTGSIAKIQAITSTTGSYTTVTTGSAAAQLRLATTLKTVNFGEYKHSSGPGFDSGSYEISSSYVTSVINNFTIPEGAVIEGPMVGVSTIADGNNGLLIFFREGTPIVLGP